MPSNRNLFGRITLTAGVLATGAVIGAMTSQAFAQGYGGYDNAPRYRVQSAPSRDPIAPPRRVVYRPHVDTAAA